MKKILIFVFLTRIYGEDHGDVTCHIKNQLGDQLARISTTLAYAWDHNLDPHFS